MAEAARKTRRSSAVAKPVAAAAAGPDPKPAEVAAAAVPSKAPADVADVTADQPGAGAPQDGGPDPAGAGDEPAGVDTGVKFVEGVLVPSGAPVADGDTDGEGPASEDGPEPVPQSVVAAAPLEAPEDRTQIPGPGNPATSTNRDAARAGLHSMPGVTPAGLFDTAGNELDPKEIFDDPGKHSGLMRVNRRVIAGIRHPGAKTVDGTLLFQEGKTVTRAHALRLIATYTKTADPG